MIVDEIRGASRGRRTRFEGATRITLGRHPDNDVSFHETRDIDASSRHAELVRREHGETYVLRDLGSSNGTWLEGARVAERELGAGESIVVEFGRGGPALKIWLGTEADSLPPPPARTSWWRRFLCR